MSLCSVHFYVKGFFMGRSGTNLNVDKMTARFLSTTDGFQSFVTKKFNISNNAHSWYDIIEFETNSPDEAFNAFYVLLYEFFEIS